MAIKVSWFPEQATQGENHWSSGFRPEMLHAQRLSDEFLDRQRGPRFPLGGEVGLVQDVAQRGQRRVIELCAVAVRQR